MKVNGTGPGLSPVDAEAALASEKAEASQSTRDGSGVFAATEGNIQAPLLTAGGQNTRAPDMANLVADVNADFKAGKISAEAAVDKIVERVLDRQVGTTGAPALRAQVETALRQTLANDPFVAAQVNALRRKQS